MYIKMISAAGIINGWLLKNTSVLTDDIDAGRSALIDSCKFQSAMYITQPYLTIHKWKQDRLRWCLLHTAKTSLTS